MVSKEILDKLAAFDTPTICNVIELFEIRPQTVGYMDARIKAAFPEFPPIVGFRSDSDLSLWSATYARRFLRQHGNTG